MNLAVDSHCHVFDTARFPYAEDVAYRPPPEEVGNAAQLSATLAANGVTHALVVNPTSGYGYDNRCLLATLRASHGRFRGVARVRPDVDETAFAPMVDAGVIGIRLDLIGDGTAVLGHPAMPRLFAHIRALRWQVHVQYEGDQLVEAAPLLRAAGVPLVVDHCGRPAAARGVAQPGFQALLGLGREGHAVKLSGAFRFSRQPAPHADVEPYVAALVETFTCARCVWGSDWPFLRLRDRPGYDAVLGLLQRWIPDDAARRRVLWDTPARLFGF